MVVLVRSTVKHQNNAEDYETHTGDDQRARWRVILHHFACPRVHPFIRLHHERMEWFVENNHY